MKKIFLYNTFPAVCLLFLSLISCTNESGIDESNRDISIQVTIKEKDVQSKAATDVPDVEKIKRYDIFIYDSAKGSLTAYKGKTENDAEISNSFTETFPAQSEDYETTEDVYIVVNNEEWNGKTEEEMKLITRNEIEAITLSCTQNYMGTADALTDFSGYKKDATGNEPFVMSVYKKGHDFRANSTLSLQLKRTYAKVILTFVSMLPDEAANANWQCLKSITVKKIANIPTETALFPDLNTDTPTLETYTWDAGSEYNKDGSDADLISGYAFDTFERENLALRVFPHTPASEADRTWLDLSFSVGAAGKPEITKEFNCHVEIGTAAEGYRIDPNSAYVVTIRYGKSDASITTNTDAVPWYVVGIDNPVYPN